MVKRMFKKWASLLQDKSGVAAVEFAFSAPMLILGVVVMTDLGLAVHERMNLDQAVRSGAEFVMNDVSDKDEIKKLVIAAATGTYSETPNDVESAERPTVTVPDPVCECPDNPGTAVSCSGTLCSNDMPPSVYYYIHAKKTYEALLLPDMSLQTEITVQVR